MNTFRKAAILTILVFLLGVAFGIWVDNYRLGSVKRFFSQIDVSWNDARLLNLYFERVGETYCDLMLEQNLAYNEKIYKEGLKIEEAIDVNRFTPELKVEKQRYVLLQMQFWLNSQELKEKCNFTYKNIVHLYEQTPSTKGSLAEHEVQSSVLLGLKEICGSEIMLIPLAVDINLTTIDTITKQYNITEYPAIIIDENIVFQGLTSFEKLRAVVGC